MRLSNEQGKQLLNELMKQRDTLMKFKVELDTPTANLELIQLEQALATNALAIGNVAFPAHCSECCSGVYFLSPFEVEETLKPKL